MLRHHFNLAHIRESFAPEEGNYFLNQNFRGRSPCRKSNGLDALQPFLVDVLTGVDQKRVGAQISGNFDQPVRVRTVRRPHHQHQFRLLGNILHRHLAVLRGIADILRVRPADIGKLGF